MYTLVTLLSIVYVGSSQTTDKTILHYHICNAVIELSLLPPPDRWEELIAMIATCQLYSEQVTGFLLALRYSYHELLFILHQQ